MLEPNFTFYPGPINVDLKFAARNNLFRHGRLFVQSSETSEGMWKFTDNFFEKVAFEYGSEDPPPLDHDNNGYWKRTSSELESWQTDRLAVNNDDGSTDAVNDKVLTATPAYQSTGFGKYYLPTSSSQSGYALRNAGSRTAADAGMAQYTTSTGQSKETGQVDIGLHYVATVSSSNGAAKDSDSDGIPDYLEDSNGNGTVDSAETSLSLAQTETGINDSLNEIYDDIDLDGDGLVGRIERIFGTDPLVGNDSLDLIPITTGEEPDFATFEVPISYDSLTNEGTLSLHMNGIPVTLEECTRATNGHCLLSFNVAYDPQGPHYLSAGFRYGSDPGTQNPVTLAMGKLLPFYSSNCVQFFEMGSMFDETSAYLDARLFVQETDYTIELHDPSTSPATHIKTITNSTSVGMIQEDWDLMMSDSLTLYTGATVRASFSVASANPNNPNATNKSTKVLTRAQGSLTEWGPNMNVVYFRTPTNDAWASDFAKNGAIWNAMQGAVDVLIRPIWTYVTYNSSFNRYLPDAQGEYPGYITKRSRTTNDSPTLPTVIDTLLPDMTNGLTKQIYIYGHGTNGFMGNYDNSAYISAADVGSRLKNTYTKTNGLMAQNPYRFVWLDGCATASGKDWRRAFGIYPLNSLNQAARNKTGPQAYVGWADAHGGGLNRADHAASDVDLVKGYTQTLNKFYLDWMSGLTVKECIDRASEVIPNSWPIPVPKNKNVTNTINGSTYWITNNNTSKIYIVGFPGLHRNGVNNQINPDKTYAAPENVE